MFEDFSDFIDSCPTPFHFAQYARQKLNALGFKELNENHICNWKLLKEDKEQKQPSCQSVF